MSLSGIYFKYDFDWKSHWIYVLCIVSSGVHISNKNRMPRMWNASVEPQSVDTQRFCDLPSSFCPFSKKRFEIQKLDKPEPFRTFSGRVGGIPFTILSILTVFTLGFRF